MRDDPKNVKAGREAADQTAVAVLGERLRPGDVVLVKGSRVAGLERVARALLTDAPPEGEA